MIRFVHFFNYAEGVSINDGETWYLDEHVSRVKKLPGILRCRSWRAEPPVPKSSPDPFDRFIRMSEIGFETLEECRKATTGNPELWAPSTKGVPGFREFECMFLEEKPQYDFMRDVPPQQYRYMSQPLKWSKGEPKLPDADETLFLVYFFYYNPDISVADGEDWYLGHHAREGKLKKLVGRKHYLAWKTLHVPEEPDSPLKPNKWFRLTELGILPWGDLVPKEVLGETQPEGTPPPIKNIWGGWRNIIINPKLAQSFLE